jgi:pyrimidine and pyridine-specific 5'-nucleotidase
LGWTTIHLVEDGSVSDHGDFQITDIHDLPKVLPELWEEKLPEIKIKRRSSTAITILS